MNQRLIRVPDGQKTKIIYGHIQNQRYEEAINILNHELTFCQKNRVLSLLAYCYYMNQDYNNASRIYEELCFLYPTNDEYKYYSALSYYNNGEYENSLRELSKIENQEYQDKISTLTAYIYYDMDDLQRARSILLNKEHENLNYIVLEGAVNIKENKISEATDNFKKAINMSGNSCELIYNLALSYYKIKDYQACMEQIALIIQKATNEYQELCIGGRLKDDELMSVGNTIALKESALVEAFNLKAAIEYNLKNLQNAKEALNDMPPRREEEFDPVTLMNHALIFFDNDPSNGFKKLNFLLQNPPFPPETFSNLLLLYAKHEYYDLAADVLAENSDLSFKYINSEDYDYIEALIFKNSSQEESAMKLDEIGNKKLNDLKRITKAIKESQKFKDDKGLKNYLREYEEQSELYIPVLMAQAKIYWNNEDYERVEKIFQKSMDYCSINETWKLNLAHVYFIQEKYIEALAYYQEIYDKHFDNILEIPAIVIANLCVSCILVEQNERAEQIIRRLEEVEIQEEQTNEETQKEENFYHLCIVNLVIGTLYCAKNNYQFGISRIIRSFDPLQKKLCTDTWYYAKRCFVSLIEKLCKNMYLLEDSMIVEILTFLQQCEDIGQDIKTKIEPTGIYDQKNSVAYEARILRIMFIKIRE